MIEEVVELDVLLMCMEPFKAAFSFEIACEKNENVLKVSMNRMQRKKARVKFQVLNILTKLSGVLKAQFSPFCNSVRILAFCAFVFLRESSGL